MPRCRERLVDDRFSISMRLAVAEQYGTGAAPDDKTMTPFAQVASDAGLQHFDVIAEAQDVDGAFIGPAVSTGHRGEADDSAVFAVTTAIHRCVRGGRPLG